MTDMDPRPESNSDLQIETDHLLRRSLAAPIPALSPEFDQRVLSELRGDAQPHSLDAARFRRLLFAGYGLCSVAASAIILRDQGLSWAVVTAATLAPLALLAAARSALGATRTNSGQPS